MTASKKWTVSLFLLLVGVVAAGPVLAGSAVIGSVAGSMNATVGGQAALPNTTIVSGDSLEVNEGAAVVAMDDSNRMVFSRQTSASFLRDSSEVTVLLSRGSVSLYHPRDGVALRVKVGEITVEPAKGFKTLGEVAMVGGGIVITAKEGSLRVAGSGSALEVAKGRTVTIPNQSARAATPGPARPAAGAASAAWQIASVAAGGTSAVLSGVAISHANSAKDAATAASTAATAANATAAQADADAIAATAAATAATTAATAAGTNAAAATTAAQAADADAIAATTAANNAQATANLVGCAIDKVTPTVTVNGAKVSPYVPPAGSKCP